MLERIERSRPTADFQGQVRAERKGKSITAAIAVICAFAAMGMLATNIFLPSLAAMAADLHVSSAAITSTISVFLAIFAFKACRQPALDAMHLRCLKASTPFMLPVLELP